MLNHGTTGGSNLSYVLTGSPSSGVSLSVGLRSLNFTNVGGVLTPDDGSGATLTVNGPATLYTLTLEDGTVVVYTSFGKFDTYKARGTSITYPTGEKITFAYNTIEWCTTNADSCPNYADAIRLQSVSSSVGYQLHYNYARDDITIPSQSNGWMRLVSVNAINTTIDPCDPLAGSCTYSQSWPTATFDTTGGATDAGGSRWIYNQTTTQFTVQRPSATKPNYVANLDSNYRVSSIVRDGQTWSYAFTPGSGTMTMVRTDPLGHTRTVVTDTNVGLPRSVTDENGQVTTYHYTNNQLDKVTYPEGNYVTYAYDARGNLKTLTRVAKAGSGLANIVTSATYPSTCADASCNQPATTTDARGKVTNYTYNTNGTLKSVTYPAPSTGAVRPQTRYTYVSVALPDSSSVSKLQTTSQCQTTASCAGTADETKSVTYWSNQLVPTSSVKSDGTGTVRATSTYGHDNIGNITSVDGPLSGTADTTTIRYDLLRRPVGASGADPDGAGPMKMRATRYTYNADGNVSKLEQGTVNSASDTDWTNFAPLQWVDVSFDSSARPVKTVLSGQYPGGTASVYAVTDTNYDALGRVNCTAVRMDSTQWLSQTNACTGQTTAAAGPDRISQFAYDNVGQVTQVQNGVGTASASIERTLTYWPNGTVKTLTDANNNLTSYNPDGFDRPWQTIYPSVTKGAGTSNSQDYEQLGYDAASNVTSRRLRDGTSIAYTYDDLNRVTLKDLPGSEPDVSYGYDNLSRLTSASQTGNALSFTYDALSRLTDQTGPQGTVHSDWNADGTRSKVAYPGTGLYVNYDYLTTGDIQKIRENGAASGVGVLATYGYDDLGNRTSLTFGNTVLQTYAFDPVSRLQTLATTLAGTGNNLTIGGTSTPIAYNAASQITSAPRSNTAYSYTGYSAMNWPYTANGLNQYVTAGSPSNTLTYDPRGNLITETSGRTTKNFGYSSENLMTSAPGATLAYDPMLRLYQVAGSTTTRFAYDGVNIIADYDGGNALQHRYVFGAGTDAPIVEYDASGNRTFLAADERGSIIARTSSSGALVATNTYDEYGIPGSANAGLFQYTGQAYIPQIGLYYYKARMYSPTSGRFMQTDPIGYADGPNWYAYTHNDPVNSVDRLGLNSGDVWCTPAEVAANCPPPNIDVWGTRPRFQHSLRLETCVLSRMPSYSVVSLVAWIVSRATGTSRCAQLHTPRTATRRGRIRSPKVIDTTRIFLVGMRPH